MSEDGWRVVGVVLALAALPVSSHLARVRGRDPLPWLVATLLLWPVALLWLALLPKRDPAAPVVRRPPRSEAWWAVFAVVAVALCMAGIGLYLLSP